MTCGLYLDIPHVILLGGAFWRWPDLKCVMLGLRIDIGINGAVLGLRVPLPQCKNEGQKKGLLSPFAACCFTASYHLPAPLSQGAFLFC